MDIYKLFKDKTSEGQSNVEESVWQNIENHIQGSTAKDFPKQNNSQSMLSKVWNSISLPAKTVIGFLTAAVVGTAVMVVVNNSMEDKDMDNSFVTKNTVSTTEQQEEKTSQDNNTLYTDNTHIYNPKDSARKEKEPVFDISDDDNAYTLDNNYHPAPPSRIENNPKETPAPKNTAKEQKTQEKTSHNQPDTLKKIDIKIPNFISPNADGINDCFNIKNIELYPDNTLIIKDRQGKVIYKQGHYNGGFCGENCVVGTYFYILSIRFNNKTQTFTGTLEILR